MSSIPDPIHPRNYELFRDFARARGFTGYQDLQDLMIEFEHSFVDARYNHYSPERYDHEMQMLLDPDADPIDDLTPEEEYDYRAYPREEVETERRRAKAHPGETWCYAHKEWEQSNDLIDFPCSPAFLNAYHAQGLTPRFVHPAFDPPPRQAPDNTAYAEISERQGSLESTLHNLEGENRELRQAMRVLDRHMGELLTGIQAMPPGKRMIQEPKKKTEPQSHIDL